MVGEDEMMELAIELFTNLFQAVMFVGFLYLFFDKPEGKLKRLIPFAVAVLLIFADSTYLTLGGTYIGTHWFYLDSLIAISILLVYSIIFLRGKWYLKLIMPLIDFGISAMVSYTFGFVVMATTEVSLETSFSSSTVFRYLCLIVVNLTTVLLLWLVLSFGSKRIKLSNGSEIFAFAIIPVLCIIIMYCNFFAYQVSGFNPTIMPYLLTICFVMVTIAVITCVMLGRISKANEMKTEYLLTSQREKLYEDSIMASNEQIEKISFIKHETKNKMSSIKKLVLENNTDEAVKLCDITLDNLKSTYTPVYTNNPVLNAIVNVEIEKATSAGIDFSVDISDTLSKLPSADTISLIGNLCDNAIEYLVTQPKEIREMNLHVRSHLNFYIITCSNRISSSILKNNPESSTTKEDKDNHGKGISILKKIAQSHNGDVSCIEEDGCLSISVVVNCIE